MAERLATSPSFQPHDLDRGWLAPPGRLGQAYAPFEDQLPPLLAELSAGLAA